MAVSAQVFDQARVGDQVKLHLADGRRVRGILERVESDGVVLARVGEDKFGWELILDALVVRRARP